MSTEYIDALESHRSADLSALQELYEHVNVLFCVADTRGYFVMLNPYWSEVLGWSIDELQSKPFVEFVHPDDRDATDDQRDQQFDEQVSVSAFENRYLTKDGQYRWLEWYSISPHGDKIYAVASDITEKKRRERELQQLQVRLKELVQNVPGAFFQYIVNTDGTHSVQYMSKGCEDLWGLTAEQIGEDPGCIWDLILPEDIEGLQNSIQDSIENLTHWEDEYRINHPSGEIRWLRGVGTPRRLESGATFWNSLVTDITETKRQQQTIEKMAYHDHLTNLPNRLLLKDRIEQKILACKRTGHQFALLFLDIDNFKTINDSLGHGIGDKLLKKVAEILVNTLRDVDTITRISGDEFVVLLSDVESTDCAEQVAAKVLEQFTSPLKIANYELNISFSIGISLFPDDGQDSETLLKSSDTAMYHAKRQGKNNYQIFAPELAEALNERFFIENELKKAVSKEQFELYFQPQINLDDPYNIQVEALIRWHHPELGLIPPDRFIPIAEETRIIVDIGDWVIKQAARQMKVWQDKQRGINRVAINVSYIQLFYGELVNTLAQSVADMGLSEHSLELELTESAILKDTERSFQVLSSLQEKGFRLSIDDFGIGYSSLSQLTRLPFNKLKIDKSFIDHIGKDKDGEVVVTSIIQLASSLGLGVIAEGVENDAQMTFLRDKGCREIQGYLFARPMPASQLEEWLAQYNAS
ncbi:EAL domain-containing protein [Aestuariibacter salexigens]|uniref:EAL domain-containing protein n=1 Tax=Aestuariibacter salexigens TaxID=226010 RepID=UPI0003F70BE6|nr:EAL domain-containing protein [Aestuariibacter salexigens]